MMNEINVLQRLGDEQLREAAQNQHPPETCPTCGLPGHSRSSNPACPFRALSKKQFMSSRLPASEDYTRVRSFDSIVRPAYRNVLITNIKAKSDYLRRTLTRLQLFLLDYATHHSDQVPPFLFTQNGLYLMTQLTRGHLNAFLERSDERVPGTVLTHWHEFNQDLLNVATYDTPGHTAELSMACKLQATANRNHITENFEGRIKKFVKFRFAVDGEEPPSRILGIIKDYVYQTFAMIARNMEPLPAEIPERHRSLTVLVLNELWAMKPPQLPTITQETMRADPGRHLPILRAILDVYDHYRATIGDENDIEVPSFTLLPLPSSKPRFVDITPENITQLTGSRQSPNDQVTRLPPFLRKLHIFWQVFAFEKLGYPCFESLRRAWIRGHFFSGVMRTDGVQLHVVFSRLPHGPDPPVIHTPDLANQDVAGFTLCGIDPGRRAVMTTSFGRGHEPHAVRRMSMKEYCTTSKESHIQRDMNRRKIQPLPSVPEQVHAYETMADIEANTPMTKTADPVAIRQTVQHKLICSESTFAFYNTDHAISNFELVKGKQRAIATAANFITTGSRKYTRRCRDKRKTRKNRKQRKRQAQRRRHARLLQIKDEYSNTKSRMDNLGRLREQHDELMDQMMRITLDHPLGVHPETRPEEDQHRFARQMNHALDQYGTAHDLATAAINSEIEALEQHLLTLQQKYLDPPQQPTRIRASKLPHHGSQETVDGLPLISFGDAMVGRDAQHFRGHAVGRTNNVRQHLIERQHRALCMVAHTNEFWTSQNCSTCGDQLSPVRTQDQSSIFALKFCTTCQTVWDRDVSAAANMFWILDETISNGARPLALTRPPEHHQPRPTLPAITLWHSCKCLGRIISEHLSYFFIL
ncbi:hypothetical protein DM01DRAFT_1122431 [Hesseltinella vesiculosa]|uniref:Cas12f1-like TNB domain-containing protein n=1 Tax=Hesseltinella vesiculosa TaxID=101127 RepID=A0A1X2GTV0_9FUNG|nr:hypothetical protein DM01DRAFT_1122431 [Hesseltinella vesiculosa]